jgi:Homeodomain-like domain
MRQTVIRLWLEGKSRKDIALVCGVSEGRVSNIISDWRKKLGEGDAEALRDLGSNLKRTGIDAAQCAQGFRISMIMRKMGVNEEDFESFVREVYEYCQRLDVTPQNIAYNLQALVKRSKDIAFAKIPEYIEKKKNEITDLEKDAKISEKKEISRSRLQQQKSFVMQL